MAVQSPLHISQLDVMSFLEDMPCKNPHNFELTFAMQRKYNGSITKSLGQGRTYLPLESDTMPTSGMFDRIEKLQDDMDCVICHH